MLNLYHFRDFKLLRTTYCAERKETKQPNSRTEQPQGGLGPEK